MTSIQRPLFKGEDATFIIENDTNHNVLEIHCVALLLMRDKHRSSVDFIYLACINIYQV